MLEYEQYKLELAGLEKAICDLDASLDIAGKKEKIAELEKEAQAQDFWDDMENSQKVLHQPPSHRYSFLIRKYSIATMPAYKFPRM